MCKVLMTVGVKKSKRILNAKFLMASLPFMSKTDNDGLGYAAGDGTNLWGERWLNNHSAFKTRNGYGKIAAKMNSVFGDALTTNEKEYNSFGQGKMVNASSILLHTRKATCSKNIMNTHPFVIDDTALIHNGVISNSSKVMEEFKETQVSTCDSEAILQEYLYNGVNLDPEQIKNVSDMIDGWYVVGVISKNKDGRQVVDVFKCDNSSLQVAWIKELENFVFCTTMDILEKTAKAAGMKILESNTLKGGYLFRFDAVTGEKLAQVEFVPECLSKNKKEIWAGSSASNASSYVSRNNTYNYHARGY
jgi:hypothetical protein